MRDKSNDRLMTFEPVKTQSKNSGEQKLYRFENGFGASVVRGPYTYGGSTGLWELAVIVWDGNDYELTYDTPVTSDVLGYLDESDVDRHLAEIEALERAS